MSDTLERQKACDAARDELSATIERYAQGIERWAAVVQERDRLCRAHEALEREMCAHSCINPSDAECIRARAPAPVREER